MKRWTILLSIFISLALGAQAQSLSPYLGVNVKGSVNEISQSIQSDLEAAQFEVIGKYNVANNDQMQVICFTRDDLKKTVGVFEDRGALAGILKIGIRKNETDVEVSILHPNYMFYAYFGDDYKIEAPILKKIDADAKAVLSNAYGTLTPFGGELDIKEIKGYHYKVMMPYFDDPIELEQYSSFDAGLAFIRGQIAEENGRYCKCI